MSYDISHWRPWSVRSLPGRQIRKDIRDRHQFTYVVEPDIDRGLIRSVHLEQDQSVTAAVAGDGECVFRPAWPITHKLCSRRMSLQERFRRLRSEVSKMG